MKHFEYPPPTIGVHIHVVIVVVIIIIVVVIVVIVVVIIDVDVLVDEQDAVDDEHEEAQEPEHRELPLLPGQQLGLRRQVEVSAVTVHGVHLHAVLGGELLLLHLPVEVLHHLPPDVLRHLVGGDVSPAIKQ